MSRSISGSSATSSSESSSANQNGFDAQTQTACLEQASLTERYPDLARWTTLLPLVWLCGVTLTAGWQRVFAADPKLGFPAHARMIQARLAAGQLPPGAKTSADAQRMLFNDRLDAVVALTFMVPYNAAPSPRVNHSDLPPRARAAMRRAGDAPR